MAPKDSDNAAGDDGAVFVPVGLGVTLPVAVGRQRILVPSVRARVTTGSLAGLLASVAAAVASWPWLPTLGSAVHGLLLALAVTLPVVLVVEMGTMAADRFPRVRAALARFPLVTQLQTWTAFMVLGAGLYGANRFLTDDLYGRQTMVATALVVLLAVMAALAVGRAYRQRSLAHAIRSRERWVTVMLAATVALVLQLGANAVFPPGYRRIDLSLHLGALAFWTLGAHLAIRELRPRDMRRVAAVGMAFCLVVAALWMVRTDEFRPLSAYARRTLSWILLEKARSFLDADGDGVSALLDGGDCDDADPLVRPLSLNGRDCLGWVPEPARSPLPQPALVAPRDQGPRLLVLVTIDSFRCGMGLREDPPLRDGCPHLTALGNDGLMRTDVRTLGHTMPALKAMFRGTDRLPEVTLLDLLRGVGFQTHGISTVTTVTRRSELGALFDDIDDSLIAEAKRAGGSTVEAGTERALQWLARVERAPGRHFLWLHHYDTHLPLLTRPGAIFRGRRIPAYAAELRRTDDQMLRLRRALEHSPASAQTLLLVTADHGEDLGELGHHAHGMSLRETTVRIPFIAWSPGSNAGRFVTSRLPGSPKELGPFVGAVLGGPTFEPSVATTFATDNLSYPQIGIHKDGWKLVRHLIANYDELFNLTIDPEERHNLVKERPDMVRSLGRLLGQRIVTEQSLYDLVERVADHVSGGRLLQEEDHRQAMETGIR